MKKYDKNQSFKCDEELDKFLKSLSKKSEFIRIAILEKIERDNLIKIDKRKKSTLEDLKRSLDNCF
jgi:ATP-dependent RNA circularization protein (DNA/RNA ligase family)